jgi:hypothetical protein
LFIPLLRTRESILHKRAKAFFQGLKDHLLLERMQLGPQYMIVVERVRVLKALKLHMQLEPFKCCVT